MESLSVTVMGEVEKAVQDNPDAIVALVDSAGICRYMSPSCLGIHGFSPDEALGRHFSEFFPPDFTSHAVLGIQDAMLTGKSVDITRNVMQKSGGTRRMRGPCWRIDDEASGRVYILSIARPCD